MSKPPFIINEVPGSHDCPAMNEAAPCLVCQGLAEDVGLHRLRMAIEQVEQGLAFWLETAMPISPKLAAYAEGVAQALDEASRVAFRIRNEDTVEANEWLEDLRARLRNDTLHGAGREEEIYRELHVSEDEIFRLLGLRPEIADEASARAAEAADYHAHAAAQAAQRDNAERAYGGVPLVEDNPYIVYDHD